MASCPKCQADLLEGLSFCTQCGAPVRTATMPASQRLPDRPPVAAPAPAKPVATQPPPAVPKPTPPSSAVKPAGVASAAADPKKSDADVSTSPPEEDKRRWVSSTPGKIPCRFCKGPLDLEGDFCEQCGAPVEDAAPPGTVKRKPQPVPSPSATPPPSLPPKGPTSSAATTAPAPPPKPAVAPPPRPKASPAAPAPRPPATVPPRPAAAPAKKASSKAPLAIGIVVLVAVAGGAAWYFLRYKPQEAPTVVAPSTQAPGQPTTQRTPPGAAPASAQPKTARVTKPEPTPAPPAQPSTSPQRVQIVNLQNFARDAYAKGNYAEPADASAIAYSKRALGIDPNDDYSKTLLENSVNGGKYQVQQAIKSKDFATARRLADTLAQLLPGRSDIAGLKEDIANAERAEQAAHRPAPAAAPAVRFRVFHMHTEKPPGEKGPACVGALSVSADRMKFAGGSASDGQAHNLEFGCSEIREIKKNARVAARQGGFHVRTASANFNFVPEDASASVVPALSSACSK